MDLFDDMIKVRQQDIEWCEQDIIKRKGVISNLEELEKEHLLIIEAYAKIIPTSIEPKKLYYHLEFGWCYVEKMETESYYQIESSLALFLFSSHRKATVPMTETGVCKKQLRQVLFTENPIKWAVDI